MASYKNQHFVPRVHLKPFSNNGEGLNICLINIDRKKFIEGAPLKHQCSKDYFYGDDLILEKSFHEREKQYGKIITNIINKEYKLNNNEKKILKRFWLLQYVRTEAASRRFVQMMSTMEDDLGSFPDDYKLEMKEAVKASVLTFYDNPDLIDDVKLCLLVADGENEFITSDNPSLFTNKWHFDANNILTPGLLGSGMLGFLPLTPKVSMVLYDGSVYSIPNNNGYINIKDADIDILNKLQILNASSNFYFNNPSLADLYTKMLEEVYNIRPEFRFTINYAVLDRNEKGLEVYKTISRDEAKYQECLVHWSAYIPKIDKWPRFIKYSPTAVVYNSHCGEGFRRPKCLSSGINYERVRLRT